MFNGLGSPVNMKIYKPNKTIVIANCPNKTLDDDKKKQINIQSRVQISASAFSGMRAIQPYNLSNTTL